MAKKLVLTFDEDTTKIYLERLHALTAAELAADCEPSGLGVFIDLSDNNSLPNYVWIGSENIGEARVDIIED